MATRTTVTLDDDVAAAVTLLRQEKGYGTSRAINELARRGLAARNEAVKEFTQETSSMGVPKLPIDNISELLDVPDRDTRS